MLEVKKLFEIKKTPKKVVSFKITGNIKLVDIL